MAGNLLAVSLASVEHHKVGGGYFGCVGGHGVCSF
jgi:hypothetical protein